MDRGVVSPLFHIAIPSKYKTSLGKVAKKFSKNFPDKSDDDGRKGGVVCERGKEKIQSSAEEKCLGKFGVAFPPPFFCVCRE